MTHPYHAFIDAIAAAQDLGKKLPSGGFKPVAVASSPSAPRVLIFAPHPDDECIIGALPLRLLRELKAHVGVVAVTQGSNVARQAGRLEELRGACSFLGWDLITTKEGGLMKITPAGREKEGTLWAESVAIIRAILERERPKTIFFPHNQDWNGTHIGTHWLVLDALKAMGPSFQCQVVETEFWAANPAPNLMVESTPRDVADLVAAISFHVEEVARNPYHLTLPAWMSDNVRRGGELVGGQGGAAPDYRFATLYRLRTWNGQELTNFMEGGLNLSATRDLAEIFA